MTNKKQVRPTSGGQTVWLTYPSQHSMPQAISYRLIFCQQIFPFSLLTLRLGVIFELFQGVPLQLANCSPPAACQDSNPSTACCLLVPTIFFGNKNFHVCTGHHFYFVYHEYPEIQKLKHRWAYVIIPLLFSLR